MVSETQIDNETTIDGEAPPLLVSQFRAMGSVVDIALVGADGRHLARARELIEHFERCWSRFLIDSDISAINRSNGQPVIVDPSTIALLIAMREGWVATGGAFDPTLLAPLVELGYRASRHDSTLVSVLDAQARRSTPMSDLQIDELTHAVTAPPGCSLDPGGIGKGLAADLVVEALIADGAEGVLVSIGGDVRVGGQAPQDTGWLIGIDEPRTGAESAQLVLTAGAVATSGTTLRSWIAADGTPVHHLLDPFTARPLTVAGGHGCESSLVEITVVAGTGAWAEVWTKAAFVRGPRRTFEELDTLGLAGRATFANGEVQHSSLWELFDAAARRPVAMSESIAMSQSIAMPESIATADPIAKSEEHE